MPKYFLAGFLIMFGVLALIPTGIPEWPVAVLAIAAGILILVDR